MTSRALLRASTSLLWAGLFVVGVVTPADRLLGVEPLLVAPLQESPGPKSPGLQTPSEDVAANPVDEPAPLTHPAPLNAPTPLESPAPKTSQAPIGAAPSAGPAPLASPSLGSTPLLSPVPMVSPAPVVMPSVKYWIVSSRQAPQDIHGIACGRLCFYERRCDGSLCPTSHAAMVSQFQPGAPVLFFMHGSYVSWEDNLVQSEGTWRWIRQACPGRPLNVVFFTWPSQRERCLLAACELRCQGVHAETNAFYVASLLACLPECHPVCLVGHSYGARMAMATLHLAGGGSIQGCRFGASVGRRRIRAVLAAGALDHNWLNDGGRYECALPRAECVLNLQNRHDVALKIYPLLRPLTSHRAIGASGVTWLDRRRQSYTCRIHEFDVTQIVELGHLWPNYYEVPQLACMLAPWIYFPDVNPGYLPAPTPLQAPAAAPMAASDSFSSAPDSASAAETPLQPVRRTASFEMTASDRPAPVAVPRPSSRAASSNGPRFLQWLRDRAN